MICWLDKTISHPNEHNHTLDNTPSLHLVNYFAINLKPIATLQDYLVLLDENIMRLYELGFMSPLLTILCTLILEIFSMEAK